MATGRAPGPPGKPSCIEVGSHGVHLIWPGPASTGGLPILDYQVLVQNGGTRPFVECVASTGSDVTEAYAPGLNPGSWYEFRVVARNAAGIGAVSHSSEPVMTLSAGSHGGVPRPGGAIAASRGERGLTEYEASKAALQRWERNFELGNGRMADENDRILSAEYSALLQRFRETRRLRKAASTSMLTGEGAIASATYHTKPSATAPSATAQVRRAEQTAAAGGSAAACAEGGSDELSCKPHSSEERRAVVREYRRVKKRLEQWSRAFEERERRAPTAEDESESRSHRELQAKLVTTKAMLRPTALTGVGLVGQQPTEAEARALKQLFNDFDTR